MWTTNGCTTRSQRRGGAPDRKTRRSRRPKGGEPLTAGSDMAVRVSVDKYVHKQSDRDLAANRLRAKEPTNALQSTLSLLPEELFSNRTGRDVATTMLTTPTPPTEVITERTTL